MPRCFWEKNKNMNQKKVKALRRALRAAGLPESKLLINTKTGQIRSGWGERAAQQRLKKASPENRALLVSGLTLASTKEPA